VVGIVGTITALILKERERRRGLDGRLTALEGVAFMGACLFIIVTCLHFIAQFLFWLSEGIL
jgi:hypothetical protein